MPIAPYHCVILATKKNDEASHAAAEALYHELQGKGIECVLDDRDLGPGVKFKDWDLIGVPLRVVFGRGFADGKVEVKQRNGDAEEITADQACDWASKAFESAKV